MKLPHELTKQSTDKFLDVFKNLYEHSPWFVEQSIEKVITDEKYDNLETFHKLLCEIMLASDTDMQNNLITCLLYTSPSPRDGLLSRMPSSA